MAALPSTPGSCLVELQQALADGTLTSVDLLQATLKRIEVLNPSLNIWTQVAAKEAIATATLVDEKRARGDRLGSLAGIPIGIKDMICTQGLRTTAGSKMLADYAPPYDATVVRRLRDADAIIVGKLNMDEFAMGSSNETSAWGPTLNPWNTKKVPGGSSGGSAAAVAAGMCPMTLGTDTGGSIRQPASFCGVVGIKPTYGRVSRWGVVAFASSLDQVGPLAGNVSDAATVLEVIAGHDPLDSTSIPQPAQSYGAFLNRELSGLRIGVPKECFGTGNAPEVEKAVGEALAQLESLGCELVELSMPHIDYAVATYYIIATAEASSNLARYDGIRYGHRSSDEVRNLDALYGKSRAEGFGSEVVRRIMLGTYVLSSGYYDAYYLKAQKARTLICRDFEAAFEQCDVMVGPTSPILPFNIGEQIEDPLKMYLMDIYTIPASLAGLPCMSLPCGFAGNGLPVGLQLVGPALQEGRILNLAHAYEQANDWYLQRPSTGAMKSGTNPRPGEAS